MTLRTPATHGLLTLMVASALLGAGGCGTDRQAAPGSPVVSADQDIWVRDLASIGLAPLAQGQKPPSGSGPAADATGVNAPSSARIEGEVGGFVSNDRITVVFPPGAFRGSRVISLDVQNTNGYIECHLFPEGLTFDLPVDLSMSLLNSTGDSQSTTVYWYDPDTDTWVDMQGAYDPSAHDVVAKLHHFSTYRAGRAGW